MEQGIVSSPSPQNRLGGNLSVFHFKITDPKSALNQKKKENFR